jgi:2-succinyl-6-hydroxy-2,4-cyclohexadiene-1-carboxylate synthase
VPESLVLLHGFASTRRLWDEVIAHLPPERYSPLALDLPGHGEQGGAQNPGISRPGISRPTMSGPVAPGRPITFEGCVADVLARSPQRFTLAGYSMGGRVALHVALSAPECVQRLVLVAATAGIEDAAERAARSDRDRRLADEIEWGSIEQFIARWRSQAMFEHDPPEVDARARREMRHNQPPGVAAALRGLGMGEMAPLWGRLGELTMPVTVLAGERDVKFRAASERMAELLPGAELVVAPGGHVLPLESPRAVAGAILTPARSRDPVPGAPRSPRQPGRAGRPGR